MKFIYSYKWHRWNQFTQTLQRRVLSSLEKSIPWDKKVVCSCLLSVSMLVLVNSAEGKISTSNRKKLYDKLSIDIVFVVDTTQGMQPYIDTLSDSIRSLFASVNLELVPYIHFGLWGYRDSSDISGIEYHTKNFTPALQQLDDFEKTLTVVNEASVESGDYPEDVFSGIDKAMRETTWTENALRLIVLLGDAPGHELNHKWNYSGKTPVELRAYADDQKFSILTLHIKRPDKKKYGDIAENQFKILSRNSNTGKSSYIPINADDYENLFEVSYNSINTFVRLIKDAKAGRLEFQAMQGQINKGSFKSLPNLVKKYFGGSRSWAVIIGINNYSKFKNGYSPLPYAVRDAKAVKKYLVDYLGFPEKNVFVLYNDQAAKGDIEQLLGDTLPSLLKERDRLLVYFSGHGETSILKNGKKFGYLIPTDGKENSLYSTCVSMRQLSDYSELIPAKQILFIIDACYSGVAGVVNKGAEHELTEVTESQVELFMKTRGRQILTAGSSYEKAKMGKKWGGHSVFTYYLLKALKNFEKSDYNKDNVISVKELELYVNTKVSKDTKGKQNPQLYNMGDTEGQFIFYQEGAVK